MEQPLSTTTQYLGECGEDPTCPFWASGNYVGPYWSNGRVQESVEWGDKAPIHALDELARQHDAAYAHYKDAKHREAADMIFAEEAKKLKQKYGSKWASDPQVAARIVEYGNHTKSQIKKLVGVAASGPFMIPKLAYHAISNMIDNQKRINGTYLKKEVGDVNAFFKTDPRKMGGVVSAPKGEPVPAGPGKPKVEPEKPNRGELPKKAETPAPKTGPTAAQIHHEELIASQRNRFINYKKLHEASQRKGPPGRLKKKGIDKRKLGYTTAFKVQPVRDY